MPSRWGSVCRLIAIWAIGAVVPAAAQAQTITLTADRTSGIFQSVSGSAGTPGVDGGVGQTAGAGGRGENGGPLDLTVNFKTFDVSTSATIFLGFQIFPPDEGIYARVRGGEGGHGGDEIAVAAQGAGGGRGGNGGSVSLDTTSLGGGIFTDGLHGGTGILVVSRGGDGGTGGDGKGATGFGGSGGLGGNGGAVTVNANNMVRTTGDFASGISAQSVSGQGGSGGNAGGIVGGGGAGNDGGNGGTVNLTSSGSIRTFGDFAYGIRAQSLGGHSGDGGSAGGVVAYGTGESSGGDGRAVTINNFGAITTTGAFAHGLFAESIGGNGGDAGGTGGVVSLGGNSGNAGDGGAVTVNNYGVISVTGSSSYGIFAQSVGGGGGNGAGSGGVVAIGGSGSGGGISGAVTVNNFGQITSRSHSIFAQSIGGGGGSGGGTGGVVSIGGTAGAGARAGDVTVTNTAVLHATSAGARGIFAQSIGGGGGQGSASGGLVSIGGAGAESSTLITNHGGNVEVENSGAITSRGRSIFAQSIGGGGGDGGTTGGWFSFGTRGGPGGDGGTVSVTNSGSLSTTDARATAIYAQSLGGGGGDGGGSVAVGAFVSVGIGGVGGGGGDGAQVDVINTAASIVTLGEKARGVQAQSVGGGGGSGGFSTAVSGGVGISASVAIGSRGGGGGDGADVNLTSSGNITTSGLHAYGLFAQSVGGGGGDGGWSIAAAGSDTVAGTFTFGGQGGGGGSSGRVTLNTGAGLIETFGEWGIGVYAQSNGGGGGDGGFRIGASGSGVGALSLSFGGKGGGGGDGGLVVVNTAIDVVTHSADAYGIFAQSVGGGGGQGGFSVQASGAGTGAGTFALGGSGGSGGFGHSVRVTNLGDITTEEDRARGLFAQSVGGGGGSGAFSIAASGAGTGAGNANFGGSGGGGGNAGQVGVRNFGAISTAGLEAEGLFAQSVGGGGGHGGFAISATGAGTGAGTFNLGGRGGGGGSADAVTVVNFGTITTEGVRSPGLVAQSNGGGGGYGGFSIAASGAGTGSGAITVGGRGGGGGAGDSVRVLTSATIETFGRESHGVFAQSNGGGGGYGSFGIGASGAQTGSGSLTLGGDGGGGGSGDRVHVIAAGSIITHNDHAQGLVAQSVGGGGGYGGFSIALSGAQTGSGAVSLGGSGGGGGNGGEVIVDNAAFIQTLGENAPALFAQSVGGGGGIGLFSIAGSGAQSGTGTFTLGGHGGAGGTGGAVTVTNFGIIDTHGSHAFGIFAQSTSDGGGAGGFSVAAGVATSGGQFNSTIGGFGGVGGSASRVEIINHNSVTTRGLSAYGLGAESVGGGGGMGGFSGVLGAAVDRKPNVAVSLGGFGGVGGAGGDVRIENGAFAPILTEGRHASGIFAHSIGGGGGDAGDSLVVALGTADGGTNLGLSIGGLGGIGGAGGIVDVINASTVTTFGERAHAILAESLGDGGGTGGFSATGVLGGGPSTANIGVSVGGFGGMGGAGGDVNVDNLATLTVRGGSASGIYAQSVGGTGGAGGFRFSGSLGIGGSKDAVVTVGGRGGTGGAGGIVVVLNSGAIDIGLDVSPSAIKAKLDAIPDPTTDDLEPLLATLLLGTPAAGIVAQSVGGGGGDGGASLALGLGTGAKKDSKDLNVAVALGGRGGDGNFGGRVDVINDGRIETRRSDSDAIFAQSVGGGGGRGGVNRAALVLVGGQKGTSLSSDVAIGGDGGSGNIGGIVFVQNSGQLITHGDISAGVRAQSIGGGGGMGGAAGGANLNLEKPEFKKDPTDNDPDPWEFVFDVQIGGRGGSGNHAGSVTLVNSGAIETFGSISQGLFAQSVGAGGGAGGSGLGGFAMVENPRELNRETVLSWIEFFADDALGAANDLGDLVKDWKDFLKGQVLDLLEEWTFVVGGDAGSSGNGDAVTVDNHGAITTHGLQSSAIFAQSIGGGGGSGFGFMTVSSPGGSAEGDFVSKAVVGGAGGAAGNGGAVTVTNTGTLETERDNAYGIFAQSVGGGGGAAGTVERSPDLFSIGAAIEQVSSLTREPVELPALHIGLINNLRPGASDGSGGAVTVTNTSDIHTSGHGATGIFAQSVGGGGGISENFAGSVGGTGAAGEVKVTQTGTIQTDGIGADGIFAQSAAGVHTGGAVTIEVTGNIFANGEASSGIFAQSRGDAGAGPITVTLHAGQIVGGVGDAAAIRFLDGSANTVNNFGVLRTAAGLDGTTIIGGSANEQIQNHGIIVGSLSLGDGSNFVNNFAGAQFYAGPTLDLGGGFFANSGLFSVGFIGTVATTRVTGFFQNLFTSGRWIVDLGVDDTADRLEIIGRGITRFSADDYATIDLNLLAAPSSRGRYTLATATEGGLSLFDLRFGTLFGEMPLGRTFAFVQSDNLIELALQPSAGAFQWTGAMSTTWTTSFVAGLSNWRRGGDGSAFVYGTPGAASDVIFAGGGATAMGANFGIRSLTFGGGGSIAGGNTLSLGAGGITVQNGDVVLAPNLDLTSDQTWANNGGGLLAIIGGVSGAGRSLTIGGSGATSIESPIQTGGGSLTKIGGGTLFLSGLNTYTGGTNVLGGMLVSNTRSLGGAIRNNAIVVFDQAEDGTYAGAMTGSGSVYKVGLGELRFTGLNTYGGGTGLLAGTLRGNSTTLQGDILADANLIFDQGLDGTYAGNLFGAGTLTKLGAGTLRMTGLGGGFTGQIVIREGRLVMDGQLGGALTMAAGTTLGGTGLVPAVTLLSGSTLAPGDSIGTLHVIGDVRFETGSTYRVETDPDGRSDLTLAGGRLGAGGGNVVVVAGDAAAYHPITRYGIFWAREGVLGPFASVTTGTPVLNPTLQYVGNEVHLTLRRTDVDFLRTGARGSAARVAPVFNALVATADGAMAQVINDVYDLPDDAAAASMRSLSGLHYQHVMNGALADVRHFVEVTLGRLGQPVPGDAIAGSLAANSTGGPGWWVRALDSRTRLTAREGDPDARMQSSGFVIGLDKRFGESLTLGFTGARTTPYVVQESFGDHTRARMFHAGAYGRYRRGASRIDATFATSLQEFRTRREVTITSPVFVDGIYDGGAHSWRAEYGRAFHGAGLGFEAIAGAHVDRLSLDPVDETGGGAVSLLIGERTASIPLSVLGARVEKAIARASGLTLRLEGRALWHHDFAGRDEARVRFAGDVDTDGFDLAPERGGREGGLFGATFYGETRGSFRAFADVVFEVRGSSRSLMASLGIGRRW